jgi:hypothetical protein
MERKVLKESVREETSCCRLNTLDDLIDHAKHIAEDYKSLSASNDIDFGERYAEGKIEIVIRARFIRIADSEYDFVLFRNPAGTTGEMERTARPSTGDRNGRDKDGHGLQQCVLVYVSNAVDG